MDFKIEWVLSRWGYQRPLHFLGATPQLTHASLVPASVSQAFESADWSRNDWWVFHPADILLAIQTNDEWIGVICESIGADDSESPNSSSNLAGPENAHPASEVPSTALPISWLQTLETRVAGGDHPRVELRAGDELLSSSVFVIHPLPASWPNELYSVRGWEERGDERELENAGKLSEWPVQDREMDDRSLAGRYMRRNSARIDRTQLELGYPEFHDETNLGTETFTIQWMQSRAINYGENGKLIFDLKENRYVVEDVDALPPPDHERFLQYVYW